MKRLLKYQQARSAVVEQMEALAAAADEENDGELTEEQQEQWDGHAAELKAIDAKIQREKDLAEAERTAPAVVQIPGDGSTAKVEVGETRTEKDPRRGFESHRDFLLACMAAAGARTSEQVEDERLRMLAVSDRSDQIAGGEVAFVLPKAFTPPGILAAVGSDEHGGYDDSRGGFAVPTQFIPGPLALGFEGDPTAGRTQSVPMASPRVDLLARTDKNHSTSVSGGFTVTRKPETVAATSSRTQMEMVELRATSLFGLAYATEEILVDSAISFVALIDSGFRDQFAHHMLREKLRGLGGAEFDGVIDAAATVAVSRGTANEVKADDVITMRSRCWNYGQAIWLANHDTLPQTIKLAIVQTDGGATPVGAGATSIYQQSLREDRPDMLLGRPIFYSEYPSTLGSKGDVILANWSQYLEGLYQPLQSAESMHVRFVNHERAFKFWLRNAGAPWWRSALTPNQSTTTLSPFVVLS